MDSDLKELEALIENETKKEVKEKKPTRKEPEVNMWPFDKVVGKTGKGF